ncbi:uncharacterized protein LOC110252335 [Exaiptasia diaphana]|uniref:Uncharacterized protein n=1 Tax=Exaiptasia diaphana TaxID=2652724 RepID=A0A913Y686_EXADI|nr:uncharacterized protein LOC110252335 [Exaiptasia diaphana]
MMSENSQTTNTQKIFVFVTVGLNLLVTVAEFLQRFLRFLLNFILCIVSLLEAVITVLLQMLKIVQDIVRALFTFGSLLHFVGHNLGVLGTFLLVLGIFTYACYLDPNTRVLRVISVCIWIVVVPLCIYAYLKRAISRLKNNIRIIQDDQEAENHEGVAIRTTNIIRYIVDKCTETEHRIDEQTQKDSPSDRESEDFAGFGGEDFSGAMGEGTFLRGQKDGGVGVDTISDGGEGSPEDQENEGSKGKGRKRRVRPKI